MKNVIKINDIKKCSGCSACCNICPVDAIHMVKDKEGFAYPEINEEECLECGKCFTVCPYNKRIQIKIDLEVSYTAYCKEEKTRMISSSGGMFALIAKEIIEEGGVVYGAAYDDSFMVYHKGIEKIEEIPELVGSKYLQSKIGYCYRELLKELDVGKRVLFVGTTCQVAGLKKFLGQDYANLICVDFICLGVPSPKIWKDYLNTFFESETIRYVNFKDKISGWNNFSLTIMGNKYYSKIGKQTYFFSGYYKGLYSRPACSECIFKNGNRVSDLTLSDCWGYAQIAPELYDNKGLSCIVCHSKKGIDVFEKIKSDVIWKIIDIEDIRKYNSNYYKSSPLGEKRSAFWKDYDKINKKALFFKYCKPEKENILKRSLFLGKKLIKRLVVKRA